MEQKWLVDQNEKSIDTYIKMLDYSIGYSKDRVKLIENILSVRNTTKEIIADDDWLKDYISSNGFIDQQLKKKTSFLAENEPFCKGLERIADYLIFPKYDDPIDKENKTNKKKEYLSKYKQKKIKDTELLIGDKADGITVIENSSKQKTFKVQTKSLVTEEDTFDFPELMEMTRAINQLGEQLGYGKGFTGKERQELQDKIKKEYGAKRLYLLKKFYAGLKSESILMKEKLRGVIYFKHLNAGDNGAMITFDSDTGYFLEEEYSGEKIDKYDLNKKYKAGDYVSVTENKIDFNNRDHIYHILNMYASLKQACYDKPDSDLWHIVNTLEELIEFTDLTPLEKIIVELKIDGLTGTEISEILKEDYKVVINENRISQVYLEVPDKLAQTNKKIIEDWIYTFKVKGTYKRCSKCKCNKLATVKNFSPQKKGKYGLKSACRDCR